MEQIITGVIATTIAAGAAVIIAGIGELMGERTGIFNFGLGGMMSLGALTAIVVVNTVAPNLWLAIAGAAAAGLVLAILFGIVTIYIKADQFLTGMAFWFLGDGLAGQLGRPYVGRPAQARFLPIEIPFLSDLPVIGKGLFSHSILVYVAYIVLPLLAAYILYKTRHGLIIRAVGQDPAAADVRGIHVDKMRFLYTCLNGVLCGIAGAYLTLSLTPSWTNGVVAGRGWIAFALVMFSNWNPFFMVFGAILFGAATSIGFVVQIQGWPIPTSFLFMLPYLATLILMVISTLARKRKGMVKTSLGPAALGLPFYRE